MDRGSWEDLWVSNRVAASWRVMRWSALLMGGARCDGWVSCFIHGYDTQCTPALGNHGKLEPVGVLLCNLFVVRPVLRFAHFLAL